MWRKLPIGILYLSVVICGAVTLLSGQTSELKLPAAETSVSERLRTLLWIKQNRILYSYAYQVIDAGGLDTGFAKLYGITPSEQQELNSAIMKAKERAFALQKQVAKVYLEEMSGTLTIEIPPVPIRGGQIYDELLAKFRAVLGAERYGYFDELESRSFDQGIDSFCAARVKFSIVARYDNDGNLEYGYTQWKWLTVSPSVEAGNSASSSSTTRTPEDFAHEYPLAASLIPANFGRSTPKR